ncbi:hypothetical protein E2C01_056630 [Portunus trituberculatus]|uniref:Secreted protein n=1 Tax=Portunus trituberculatus TaxID=210409 RepID=A0A5B7GYR6_PORTR|nr:hypothetical protein [Portunus trituberculatus]
MCGWAASHGAPQLLPALICGVCCLGIAVIDVDEQGGNEAQGKASGRGEEGRKDEVRVFRAQLRTTFNITIFYSKSTVKLGSTSNIIALHVYGETSNIISSHIRLYYSHKSVKCSACALSSGAVLRATLTQRVSSY